MVNGVCVCVCAAFTRQVWRSVCDVLGSDVWVTRDIFSLSFSCCNILQNHFVDDQRALLFSKPRVLLFKWFGGTRYNFEFPARNNRPQQGLFNRSLLQLASDFLNQETKLQNYKTHKKEIQSNDALDSNAEKADFYWQKRNKTGGYASALHVRIFSRKSFNQTRRERER